MGRRALALLAALAVAIGGVIAAVAPEAEAAETFDPGNIIDDSLFYDSSAMTAAQIQSFLDSKIGACQSDDCINILRASVSSRPARVSDSTGNLICNAFTGGTNLRISEIIYRAQVACGISAKVILVTLQKEQGLVTSKNPSDWNLNYAMGQACPDTAPCDPAYKGIGVQIISGATQLKTYRAANFARQPGVHNIQYSPTASCGTKRVTIKNYATAALYNYTPYTPNDAALRNLYGIGDNCSSYGNRNFWRDYNDWFGSTRVPSVATLDTVPHLLALDAAGGLRAYVANGKGGWLPRQDLTSLGSGTVKMFAPGDMDGDGHRDLITIDRSGSTYLDLGDGALGYHSRTQVDVDWSQARLLADVGDFSGDGIPDVLTSDTSGDLMLWRGDGGRGFRAPVKVGVGWQIMDLIVGAGDFDGDRRPDLIARESNGSLWLYRGDGRGGWAGRVQIGWGWQGMTAIYVLGDFNGDDRPDVIAQSNSGELWLYRGIGSGRITGKLRVGHGFDTLSSVSGPGAPAPGVRVLPAGAGDIDGDGKPDALSVAPDGRLQLLRGNGLGRITSTEPLPVSVPTGARVLPMGDFNSDRHPDLGIIDAAGNFWLYRGTGSGDYLEPLQIGHNWHTLDLVLGTIDFDADGNPDVIGRTPTGDLLLYSGDGRGGWRETRTQIGWGWQGMTAVFNVGDFDGDRLPDVLARRPDGGLMLYGTNGSGGWNPPRQVGWGWHSMTIVFSPGNFDLWEGPDILARSPDGTLWLYPSDGKGTFRPKVQLGSGWQNALWMG